MQNPFKKARYNLSLQSAIDEGFAYDHRPPEKLSEQKRKELMETSALETPRSKIRSLVGVLAPYVTKASTKEKIFAVTLLGGSLFLNQFSVEMTVDFGNWLSTMTNTVAQGWNAAFSSRPDIIADMMNNYPMLQEALNTSPLATEMLLNYPDATKILQDPAFRDLISQNPGLLQTLQGNPTIEQVFMQHPDFAAKVAENPELLERLGDFRDELGQKLQELPAIKKTTADLLHLCGGAFLENSWNFLSTSFNSAVQNISVSDMLNKPIEALQALQSPWNDQTKAAFDQMWQSKDMTTIALKFTAAAIASYKASQYLILRWRSWSTGYYTGKWTSSKAFARLKSTFNNIDNPGQRLQEDPGHFSGASVSLMTGVVGAGMTLEAFGGMLYGMGPVFGVNGGFLLIGGAYAATVLGLTTLAGYKLPGIFRNKQRVEANLRRSTDNIHNNAEQIALTNSESTEKDLVKKRVTPVMKNSVREIGTQVKMIVVDATIGNVSIPLPYVIAWIAAVSAGTASFGTVQTLNYAFNRVNSSLSFIVNRFEQISNWIATSQRIYAMDKAMDASHYIEEEKRQLSAAIPPPAPEAP